MISEYRIKLNMSMLLVHKILLIVLNWGSLKLSRRDSTLNRVLVRHHIASSLYEEVLVSEKFVVCTVKLTQIH